MPLINLITSASVGIKTSKASLNFSPIFCIYLRYSSLCKISIASILILYSVNKQLDFMLGGSTEKFIDTFA